MKPLSLQRHLVTLPLNTLLENICGSYVPLLLGVTACVRDINALGFSGSNQFSPEIFAEALRRWHPQTLVLVPELLRALMIIHRRSPEVTAPLRYVAVGGARVSQQLISTARSAGLPIFEGYGLSECGSVVALNHQHHEMAGSAGKPLEGVSLTFHDAELHVRSPGNALGYLGEAPFTGSIATGDLAEQDTAGFIHIRGRRKNVQINAFGRNFSPEWVEAEAMNCTAVRRLVIFGEGLKKNVALVHTFEGMEASA
uniref:AMP-dependent synthetase/ligase domain-containing protein n=1 Tax=Acyrthosiphon pisum TaxID=7029 RepID=A0A8R2D799_ACYPI